MVGLEDFAVGLPEHGLCEDIGGFLETVVILFGANKLLKLFKIYVIMKK